MNKDTIPYHERLKLIKLGQLPKEAVPKQKKFIPKISEKKKKQLAEQKEAGNDNSLDLFFVAMRKKCKGKCLFCNSPTTYKHEELWRIAIAHLLPKAKFKSVATEESNWIELCWNCHTEFDTGKITWELLRDSKEFDILREKLFIVLPLVAPEERKNKLYSKLETLVYKN